MVGPFAWRLCLCVFVAGFTLNTARAQPDAAQANQSSIAKPGFDSTGDSLASDQNLSGLAVIVKVEPVAGETLFHADGYRIRVSSGTVINFQGSLKSLAEVVPGTWIRFEGVRDDTGVLVAQKAAFFPPGTRNKTLTAMGPKKAVIAADYQPLTQNSLVDVSGHFVSLHTKVRYSGGWYMVPADQALQERVERIGMSVVPAYQKVLPPDSPSRIPFRFYAVADDKIRTDIVCDKGLILVPKKVVERLQSDDQLAAVLADGIAFNLKRQLGTLSPLAFAGLSSDVLAVISALFPAEFIAGEATEKIVDREILAKLQRDCDRIALQLTADAGYDPWQAPEAWRLLAPKDPPRDIQSLKYTRDGEYQLSILKLQYNHAESGKANALPPSAKEKSR